MSAPAVELGLNHPAAVSSLVQLAPDGALCTGAKDGKVRIWDLRTGGILVMLDGHKLQVNCVCQLRDGRICSGSNDKTLRVWGARDAYVSPAPGVLRPANFDPTAPVPQEQCCAIM
jgi:WD40 repeat protein